MSKNEKNNADILKKILYSIYAVVLLLVVLVFLNACQMFKGTSNNTTSSDNSGAENSDSEYDISQFESIDADGALRLFEKKGYSVVIYGSSTCGYCKEFIKSAKKIQNEIGFKHYYTDMTSLNKNSDDYATLMKKYDKKTTLQISGEEQSGTYGDFFIVTPITVIIKDGKMVDGLIGYASYEQYKELLAKNGIE